MRRVERCSQQCRVSPSGATAVATPLASTGTCQSWPAIRRPSTENVAAPASGAQGRSADLPIKMAAGLLMTIPVAVVFFAFQRYFVRGAGSGAVQG